MTERYELFPSMEKGNDAKVELVDKNVVVERQVRAKDVQRKLLELTTTGRECADEVLDLDVENRGRGGIVHRFWQHRIQEVFESAGWPAALEVFDADVYVNMGDTELVVEVAMDDKPREVEHVDAHVDTFDTVWVVCRNEKVRDGLRERIEKNGGINEDVSFRLFRDFTGQDFTSLEDFDDFGLSE